MKWGLTLGASDRQREVLTRLLLAVAAVMFLGALTPTGVSAQSTSTPTETPTADTPTAETAPSESTATTVAPADSANGPSVVTTLVVEGTALEGVDLVVEADGEEIGRQTTDAEGVARVTLPGPGKYTVRLDPDTLPDGVAFAEGARRELSPTVRATGDRAVIFRLVDEGSAVTSDGGDSTFTRVLNLLVSGIRFGLIIALGAVGLSVIFGTTSLTNFAHGELLTFGAMAAWYLNSNSGGLGLPLLVAGALAIALSTLFGLSFEYGLYRPLRAKGMPMFSQMVVSIGVAFAVRYLFSVVFGSSTKQYSQYAAQSPTLDLGPLAMRPKDLVISLIAFVALIAVGLFLSKSRMGTAIRAVSDNQDLAIASGIDHLKVTAVVWGMAGGLAGLAGVMLGSSESVGYLMGQRVLLVMFAAVLLGGLGTAFGAIVGGLFVGVVSDLSTLWLDSDLKIIVALGTLVLVLLTRPQGVFGVKARTA
ncbi:MAG: branched-chain amino acid ABC transporter permease [Actinobacteria bacterium]|nr:branched-chain amino acid ABC transporter permease [Actinomycetota bacterium]